MAGTSPRLPFVFNRDGQPIGEIKKTLKRAFAEVGLVYGRRTGRTFHGTRRTAVTNLVESGVPRSVAKEITGIRPTRCLVATRSTKVRHSGQPSSALVRSSQRSRPRRKLFRSGRQADGADQHPRPAQRLHKAMSSVPPDEGEVRQERRLLAWRQRPVLDVRHRPASPNRNETLAAPQHAWLLGHGLRHRVRNETLAVAGRPHCPSTVPDLQSSTVRNCPHALSENFED